MILVDLLTRLSEGASKMVGGKNICILLILHLKIAAMLWRSKFREYDSLILSHDSVFIF